MGAGSRKTHGGELEGEVKHREGEKRSLGCGARPQGEHLPRAGAQQRPSGGRPREMQLAVSQNLPKTMGGALGTLRFPGHRVVLADARHRAAL